MTRAAREHGCGPALIARGCVDEPTRKLAADAYAGLTEFVVRELTDATGHRTAEDRPGPHGTW